MAPESTLVASAGSNEREAAFRRARRNLENARAGDRWPTTKEFWFSPFWRCVLSLAASVAAGVALIVFVIDWDGLAAASWSKRTIESMSLALLAGLFCWTGIKLLRNLHVFTQDGPFDVLIEFYARASDPKRHDKIHELVATADFDGRPRLLPPRFWAEPADDTAKPQKESESESQVPSGLLTYWRQVTRRGAHRRLRLSARENEMQFLAPDLALVDFDLVEREFLHPGQFVSSGGYGLLGVALGGLSESHIGPVLHSLVAVTSGSLMGMLMSGLPLPRKRTTRLQKLLVHTNGKWRVFSGEWQGTEETDLSWFASKPPVHVRAARPNPGAQFAQTAQP